jgi:hypothetical protein
MVADLNPALHWNAPWSNFSLEGGSGSGSRYSSKWCELATSGIQTLPRLHFEPPRVRCERLRPFNGFSGACKDFKLWLWYGSGFGFPKSIWIRIRNFDFNLSYFAAGARSTRRGRAAWWASTFIGSSAQRPSTHPTFPLSVSSASRRSPFIRTSRFA